MQLLQGLLGARLLTLPVVATRAASTIPATTTPEPTTTIPATTTPEPTTTIPATTTPEPTTTIPATTTPVECSSGYFWNGAPTSQLSD
jgi:hypothetical protein